MLRNEKGITLVELIAALLISTMLIGTVTLLVQYSHDSVSSITEKENALRESRDIVNHIVNSVRTATAVASSDPQHILKLDLQISDGTALQPSGDYIYYSFNPDTHELTVDSKKGAAPLHHVLSAQVSHAEIAFKDDNSGISLKLTMLLPNNKTHTRNEVVYFPKLKL